MRCIYTIIKSAIIAHTSPACISESTRDPDVEVSFHFNNIRKNATVDGYRPTHLIDGVHLTSGTHHYYGVDRVLPGKTAIGTITFIQPDAYPNCLWVGKEIPIQEGERIVGMAKVLKIFNKSLEALPR